MTWPLSVTQGDIRAEQDEPNLWRDEQMLMQPAAQIRSSEAVDETALKQMREQRTLRHLQDSAMNLDFRDSHPLW